MKRRLSFFPVLIFLLLGCQAGRALPNDDEVVATAVSTSAVWTNIQPERDTLCAYGDPFSFWVHRGQTNRLLIYFQRGGSCWDAEKCTPDSGFFNGTVMEKDHPQHENGVFQLDNPDNPFRDYSIVYIPSCTGDVFWGDTVKTYTPVDGDDFMINHRGFVNAQAALDWAYVNMPTPKSVFVAGCEAGSVGSWVHIPWIIKNYPHAMVTQFSDSGAFVWAHPVRIDISFEAYKTFPYWIPTLADLTTRPFVMAEYDIVIANYYAPYTFAAYNTESDSRQTFFYATNGTDAAGFPSALAAHLNQVHAATDNFRSYTASGDSGCILSSTNLYTQETEGTLIRDWIDDLANGRSVDDVVCATCAVTP